MSFKHFLTVALLSLSSVIVMAQNKRITGTVVDTNGDPVIGAGVTHVGTTNGVVTDGKGNYVFSVPDGATINVEALGFEPQQFTVASGRNVYDVTLVESATELDETVVVGYGTQRKRLITGSTVNVSGDKLAAVNAVDAFGALQSQAAGVTIVQNSGQPGESYKMTIRGMGTAGSTTPLYVVDGVPGGSIEALSPNDIESIDVLKDAASSAIYGARAANGVVLVTTKKGKAGKIRVTMDAYYGWQNPNTNGVTPLNALERYQLARGDHGPQRPDPQRVHQHPRRQRRLPFRRRFHELRPDRYHRLSGHAAVRPEDLPDEFGLLPDPQARPRRPEVR